MSSESSSPVATGSVQELLQATGRLGTSDLDEFIASALQLKAGRMAPVASARESELLQKINTGLSEDLSDRFEALREKRQAEALTPEEHAELIGLGDEVERREANRLEALSELASLRKTPLLDLMQSLGLTPPSHE